MATSLSPAAQLAVTGLLSALAADGPEHWTVRGATVQQIIGVLIRTAALVSQDEADPTEVLGTLTAAAAWIAEQHGVEFLPPGKIN